MFISDVAVKRPVFATVLSFLLVVFGLISFSSLPLREYPKIDQPRVSVGTSYVGASADIVETRVTQVIEDQLSGIEGIRYIRSTSRDGRSNITIEFNLDRDLDEAANDVRDAVSRATGALPVDVDPPQVTKAGANSGGEVIMWNALISDTMSPMELSDYAQRNIIRRLSVIDGVASVFIGGERRPAMRIWLDRGRLSAHGLTALDIDAALRQQNVELPGGSVESGQRDFPIRVTRGYQTAEDFAQLVLREGEDGRVVRLGDVARVERAPEEHRRLLRTNGLPVVGMGIIPQSDANQIEVAERVREELERVRQTLPPEMRLESVFDATEFVSAAIVEVWRTLGIAIALVLLVIFLFLGNIRSAMIPAVVVPVCLTASFIALASFGFSINIITLLALILAIGLVVDDSIVVLENIERRIGLGEPPLVAAYRGARQVGFAVIATTLVLIAAFVSLAFLQGFVGLIFRELALTISAAVAFSSLVALTLSPVMCSRLLQAKPAEGERRGIGLAALFNGVFNMIATAYEGALSAVVKRADAIGLILLALTGLAGFLWTQLPRDLAPVEDRGNFFVAFRFAEGSGFEHAREQVLKIEDALLEDADALGLRRIFLLAPGFGRNTFDSGFGFVRLEDWNERDIPITDALAQIQGKLYGIPGVQAFAGIPEPLQQSLDIGADVSFVLMGPDFDTLNNWANTVTDAARANPGLQGVRTDYQPNTPQLRVNIDKNRAADLGVTASDIGRTMEILMASRRVTTFADRGEEYNVIIQAQESDRNAVEDILNYTVRSQSSGQLIPLSNMVSFERFADSPDRNRLNRLRSITISAGLANGYTQGEALEFLEGVVQEQLAGEPVQIGYLGGSLQYQEASNAFLFVFGMALLIVYLVLAAQFESFIHPFVIMLTVPVAVTGGLFALYMNGISLNIYSQIGLVILVGLAAKNGILIVEFANQLRDQGRDVHDAVMEASKTRLRPILMTGLSTAFGALPLVLALGPGAESRKSIGWVIFSGVIFATLLTIFVVPVFYRLLARFTGSPGRIARALSQWEYDNRDRDADPADAGDAPAPGAGAPAGATASAFSAATDARAVHGLPAAAGGSRRAYSARLYAALAALLLGAAAILAMRFGLFV